MIKETKTLLTDLVGPVLAGVSVSVACWCGTEWATAVACVLCFFIGRYDK